MKICSRQGKFELMSVNHSARSGDINRDILSIFFNMKVFCVFSLELPHRGDTNEYKQHTIFNIKKKISLNFPKSAATEFFQDTQDRVRNSGGKRANRVQVIDVLL